MPSKALGLLVSLVLAALVSWGLGYWIDQQMAAVDQQVAVDTYDGSILQSVQYWNPDNYRDGSELALVPDTSSALSRLAFAYDRYLYRGGGQNWLAWRTTYETEYGAIIGETEKPSAAWRAQVLRTQNRATPTKWIALIGFSFIILVLWSRRLKHHHLLTPIFYGLVVGLTLWTYGSLSAPFWCLTAGLSYLAYAFGLWLLPMYRLEWVRSLRPLLTPFLVILAAIAWRGPDWVDRLLLTGGLWRFILLSICLFGLFLHWDHISRAMRSAKLGLTARIMGYVPALGGSWLILGLILGFWGSGENHGLAILNRELLIVPEQWAVVADPDLPFGLFFLGFGMVIVGGIGYFIQRIAR